MAKRCSPVTRRSNRSRSLSYQAWSFIYDGDQTHRPDSPTMARRQHTYFPPVGGFRFGLFTVPPDSSMTQSFDVTAAIREFNEKLPGLGEQVEPDHPG